MHAITLNKQKQLATVEHERPSVMSWKTFCAPMNCRTSSITPLLDLLGVQVPVRADDRAEAV